MPMLPLTAALALAILPWIVFALFRLDDGERGGHWLFVGIWGLFAECIFVGLTLNWALKE